MVIAELSCQCESGELIVDQMTVVQALVYLGQRNEERCTLVALGERRRISAFWEREVFLAEIKD